MVATYLVARRSPREIGVVRDDPEKGTAQLFAVEVTALPAVEGTTAKLRSRLTESIREELTRISGIQVEKEKLGRLVAACILPGEPYSASPSSQDHSTAITDTDEVLSNAKSLDDLVLWEDEREDVREEDTVAVGNAGAVLDVASLLAGAQAASSPGAALRYGHHDDLNTVAEEELDAIKRDMDVKFEQNQVAPGEEGFVYDKQVAFGAPDEASGWDSSSDSSALA